MFITSIICWTALGLFWHTAHVMALMIIIYYIIFSLIFKKNNSLTGIRGGYGRNLFIIYIILFISTWIYVRDTTFINSILLSNYSVDISSLFLKGSSASLYSYKSYLPIEFIDYIRYFGYIIGYTTMAYMSLYLIRKRKISIIPPWIKIGLLTLLFADASFQLLYFFPTGTLGPRIFVLYSVPFIIICLYSIYKYINKLSIKIVINLIVCVLVFCITTTSLMGYASYYFESDQKNISIDEYDNSFNWIEDNLDNIIILSDSHTTGHFSIFYYLKHSNDCDNISTSTYTTTEYEDITHGTFKLENGSIGIVNVMIYERHLSLNSLERWNNYEPFSPSRMISSTDVNLIYSCNNILILK